MPGPECHVQDYVRSKLQPDRAAIFSLVWNWSRALADLEIKPHSTCDINEIETPLVRLIETEGHIISGLQGIANLHVFRSRGLKIAIAEDYEKLAVNYDNNLFPHHVTDRVHGSGERQGQQSYYLTRDPVLDKMTRDLYGLNPKYEFNPEDPKRKTVKDCLHVGLVLLALVRKMDWAALLILGIQLSDDEYA